MNVSDLLPCNTELQNKFIEVGIPNFYKYLGSKYHRYKIYSAKLLIFRSTYVRYLFSIMEFNKSNNCSRIKYSKLNAIMQIETQNEKADIKISSCFKWVRHTDCSVTHIYRICIICLNVMFDYNLKNN